MIHTNHPEKKRIIPKNITKDQAKDTGMAIGLICLIIALVSQRKYPVVIAIAILVLDLVYPMIYRHVARLWLGLSQLVGMVVSKILLTVIFFIVVTPTGLIRRLAGFDTLRIKIWKNDNSSVFKIREHTYTKDDIKTPY